jgi:hypothetical protein
MITEKLVKNFNSRPIIVKKKAVPQSVNNSLPMLFNTQLYIGSKGTGKSYKLTQLLKNYEESKIKDDNGIEYEMRVILICPTASSGANEIFKILKSIDFENDVHLEYTDELLLEILDDIKGKQEHYDEFISYKKIYDKFIKIKNINKIDYQELSILEQYDFMSPTEIFGDIKPNVNFLVFDDLIGTGMFNKKAKSLINNLVIKHRHLKTNLIFTTQSFKAIPPIIRTNIDIYCIFKSSSYNEIINKIHEDISGFVKLDDFITLYEYATQERNDCLTIINNSMQGTGSRFFRNWDKELILTN